MHNILIYIGIINLFVAIAVYIFLIIKKEKTKGFLLFLFIVLCPLIGPSFIFFSWCIEKVILKKEISIKELSFNTESLDMITEPDFYKELNTVPVEEALLVSDNINKRRVILDVLKEDYNNSLSVISNALESDDSETSHYVATIITDVKSNFKVTVQKMQETLNEYPDDAKIYCLLVDYIHTFLEKDVLSEIEQKTYIDQYVKLMNELFFLDKKAISSIMYNNIINHLLVVDNGSEALLWGERSISQYPNELNAYKGLLKIYYRINDREKFFEALKKLKDSDIKFDNESIELVRYYQV